MENNHSREPGADRDPHRQKSAAQDGELTEQGYAKALDLLHACATEWGFLASPTNEANYRRVWGRDGAIIGLAALLTGDGALLETTRRTFETLAENQGPHGEIPSNVDPVTWRISYGGTAGRVDADLWFVIGCGEYWKAAADDAFLKRIFPHVERTVFLLGAWEFNNRGLLYIPQTGDWSDEYIHSGYILYDELLYLQALRAYRAMKSRLQGGSDRELSGRIDRLKRLIGRNYWFDHDDDDRRDIYHEVLFDKGLDLAPKRSGRYWLPFFSPTGYGYRFDAMANVMVSLVGCTTEKQNALVDGYIAENTLKEDLPLLPAFHPVIQPRDEDWEDLQMNFSYTFKNRPYEYQNGGLWAIITGLYVADLAGRGKTREAERLLRAVHRANALEMDGEPWGFPEFVHGLHLAPGGTRGQGWSAAGAVIGHHALQGAPPFRIAEGAS